MSITDPFSIAFQLLEAIIAAEFSSEGLTLEADNLHESLGWEGPRVGAAPISEIPWSVDMLVQDLLIEMRFYDKWDKEINPEQAVDPRLITNKAERFRRAVKTASINVGTSQVWYFDVISILYPNDATGNKTRFVATLRVRGNNAALVETTG